MMFEQLYGFIVSLTSILVGMWLGYALKSTLDKIKPCNPK